jgi:hypothetical protein
MVPVPPVRYEITSEMDNWLRGRRSISTRQQVHTIHPHMMLMIKMVMVTMMMMLHISHPSPLQIPSLDAVVMVVVYIPPSTQL